MASSAVLMQNVAMDDSSFYLVNGTTTTNHVVFNVPSLSDNRTITILDSDVTLGAGLSGNNFATDLKIGRDADNLIDFTVDDEITFRAGATDELKLTATELAPETNDGLALGSTALRWADIYFADGAVINLGNDQDVTLTHVPDSGLLLNGASQLQFRDNAIHISSDADGDLNIQADTTVNLNIGGTDELSITATTATFGTNIVIPNAGTIGSANDNDALAISSTGDITLSSGTESTSTSTGTLVVSNSGGVGIGGNVFIGGNLTVNGTTTTVESTVVNIQDPIFTLGGTTANPAANDSKDRGIEFKWNDGTAKTGFFGYDKNAGKFTFIPNATNTLEVFSGTAGDVAFGAGEFTSVAVDNITIDGNIISSTNGDITLDPNGTGSIINTLAAGACVRLGHVMKFNVDTVLACATTANTATYTYTTTINADHEYIVKARVVERSPNGSKFFERTLSFINSSSGNLAAIGSELSSTAGTNAADAGQPNVAITATTTEIVVTLTGEADNADIHDCQFTGEIEIITKDPVSSIAIA